jgi:hypothetical protein
MDGDVTGAFDQSDNTVQIEIDAKLALHFL